MSISNNLFHYLRFIIVVAAVVYKPALSVFSWVISFSMEEYVYQGIHHD